MSNGDNVIKRNQEKRDNEPEEIKEVKKGHWEIDKFVSDGQIRAEKKDE